MLGIEWMFPYQTRDTIFSRIRSNYFIGGKVDQELELVCKEVKGSLGIRK